MHWLTHLARVSQRHNARLARQEERPKLRGSRAICDPSGQSGQGRQGRDAEMRGRVLSPHTPCHKRVSQMGGQGRGASCYLAFSLKTISLPSPAVCGPCTPSCRHGSEPERALCAKASAKAPGGERKAHAQFSVRAGGITGIGRQNRCRVEKYLSNAPR